MPRLLALTAGFAAALAGCDAAPRTYPVVGTVSWQGQPVADGRITLVAEDGKSPPASAPIAGGRFELRATPGPKRVEVYNQRVTGFSKAMNQPTRTNDIPPEYNAETRLRYEVRAAEDNTCDLALPQR